MANSRIKFLEMTSERLESYPISEGNLIFTTDTFNLYRDTSTQRVLLSKGNSSFISEEEPQEVNIGDLWFILS